MLSIEKNKNYIVDITGITHEGQGVGRIDTMAVFVDGALEGEQVEVKIIKLNKSYAVGKMVRMIKPSPHRIEPFCEAYRRCGGCSLQHMDYAAQLGFKQKLVRDSLKRIGGLKDVVVHKTIGMEQPFSYRNKAQYPVAEVKGRVVTGFYAARSHDVIDSEECGIQDAVSDKVRKIVRRFLEEKGISIYDETSGKGLVRHILTRTGFHTGEVMVVLVVNGKTLPFADELVQRLVHADLSDPDKTFAISGNSDGHEMQQAADGACRADGACGADGAYHADGACRTDGVCGADGACSADGACGADGAYHADGACRTDGVCGADSVCRTDGAYHADRAYPIKSIYLNSNTEKTNVILGRSSKLLYGSETITDFIGHYQFHISPHSFFQVNPVQTEVLYTKALEYAGLTGSETVFDLYCGIGTISLFLSSKAQKVYGVEVVEAAVADARKNAAVNGVDNAEFYLGEAEKVVPELYEKGIRADVVVLDPPRKGCEESLLHLLSEMQPDRIVYVSCNPSTLARDLKYLDGHGYKAVEAQPVDMFPWSGHVETIVLIQRAYT